MEMELDVLFTISLTDRTVDHPYVEVLAAMFPMPLPEFPPEQQRIYEGEMQCMLIVKGLPERTLKFLVDFHDPNKIKIKMYENQRDLSEELRLTMGSTEMQEDTQMMLVAFIGNFEWIKEKLLRKIRPGKTVRGGRRMLLPAYISESLVRLFMKAA